MTSSMPAGPYYMTEPQIEQRPAQPYLGIAGRITDGVPAFVDKAFPELYRWLGEHGVEPSGPPFIRFRELDPDGEPLEIEAAAPVEGNAEGDERVQRGHPASRPIPHPHSPRSVPERIGARPRHLTRAADQVGGGAGHRLQPRDHHGTTLPAASSAT